jgi:hypothetical protein
MNKKKFYRKFWFLRVELLLEGRKVINYFNNSFIGSLKNSTFCIIFSKFYLLFIVVGFTMALSNLQSTASSKDRLSIQNEAFVNFNTQPLIFEAPAIIIPTITVGEFNNYYQVYKIKPSETLEVLASRFGINQESLTINNPGSKFEVDNEIIKPSQNGYLFGFKSTYSKEKLAKHTKLSLEELNLQVGDKTEGYILVVGDNPVELKNQIDQSITREKYQLDEARRISIANQIVATKAFSNNIPNSNLSSKLNAFIGFTKGKIQHDGNNNSYGQCVSLVKQWQLFLEVPTGIWYGNYPRQAYFAYLGGYNNGIAPANSKYNIHVIQDVNNLQAGDIVVLTGYPSHTGVATGNMSDTQYDLYEQNPGTPGIRGFSKNGFIGALRYVPK